MKSIPNRPAARWLPSRSQHGLFKLIGYFKSRDAVNQQPRPGMLMLNSGQNALEAYSMALWLLALSMSYTFALLAHFISTAAAVILTLFLAPLVLQVPFYTMGLLIMPLWRRVARTGVRSNVRANSIATVLVFTAASLWFLSWPGWVRRVSIVSLLLVGANIASAMIMWVLRDRVRRLESECGA